MTRLTWDQSGERLYETGVKRGVVYPYSNGTYPAGVAWNGLTSVTNSASGGETSPLYADDIKYLNLMSTEEYEGTIEAYTYPVEFAECDGSKEIAKGVIATQQTRKMFGLCYRTTIGNDVAGTDYGYKLHLVYGALASPSEKTYETQSDDPDAITFSWDFTTTPIEVDIEDVKPIAHLEINSTTADADKLAALEDALYGTADAEPYLPLPEEVVELIGTAA